MRTPRRFDVYYLVMFSLLIFCVTTGVAWYDRSGFVSVLYGFDSGLICGLLLSDLFNPRGS